MCKILVSRVSRKQLSPTWTLPSIYIVWILIHGLVSFTISVTIWEWSNIIIYGSLQFCYKNHSTINVNFNLNKIDMKSCEKCHFWWEVWETFLNRWSLLMKYSHMNCGLKGNWSGASYLGASHPNVCPFHIQRSVITSHVSHQIWHFSPEPNPHMMTLNLLT